MIKYKSNSSVFHILQDQNEFVNFFFFLFLIFCPFAGIEIYNFFI